MYLSYTFPRMIYTSYMNNEALGCVLCCSWQKMKISAICGSGLTYTCICLCSKMRFSEGLHVISFNSNRAALHLYNKTLGFR